MKSTKTKLIFVIQAVLTLAVLFSLDLNVAAAVTPDDSYISVFEQYRDMADAFGGAYRYDDFLSVHTDTPRPYAEYVINAADFILADGMDVRVYEDYQGMPGASVWTDEEGIIKWEVYVEEGGLYNISVNYFSAPGRNSEIQRTLFINGEMPYFEAGVVNFYRTWVNKLPAIERDSHGNDMRPTQVEKHRWNERVVRDALGEHNEPLLFYFHQGRNVISFLSQREPMVINSIRIFQSPESQPYAHVSADFNALPHPSIETIRIEGEDSVRRSSAMLAPRINMAGPGVYPYNPRHMRVNYIGGVPWSQPGDWIEWEFEVPESGLYKIAMNIQQNFHRGTVSNRRITINGAVPFSELESVHFGFSTRWRVETLGSADNPFLFYLEKGTHTLRMEAVLGDYAPFLREIQASVMNLNRIYRQIVMVTGVTPDIFRDYHIGRRVVGLHDYLTYERDRLEMAFQGLLNLSDGNLSERDVVVRSMREVIDSMLRDLEDIPRILDEFRIRIGGLGTWIMQVRNQSLSVDALFIMSVDAPTPANGGGLFARIRHEIMSLILSFFIDFNNLGSVADSDTDNNIEVWLGTGRDQAVIVRSLIDESFTRDTGIGVNLMLVDMGMLLPATVSGQGPDLALGQPVELPMNFAFRGTVADISGFQDFQSVTERFSKAAMAPFMYGDMAFALPETLSFYMMFYRRDILHELGLTPPETWDDVRASIAVLDHHHMEFGIPADANTLASFGMFLLQNGGEFYSPCGRFSALNSRRSLDAFRDFTRFFSDYRLPREFDFVNRFRAGEMPMGIFDYTAYNMLQVFAPEIRGQWGFRAVPGTLQPDGSINRAVTSSGTGIIMMEQSNEKDASWEFMKWWTSADIQTRFGNMMESVMGSAARHPTANLEAFGRMPWPVRDYRSLREQFNYVHGIPQVPGGYFTPRYVRNAFYTVVESETMEARDALRDVVSRINIEIETKRREFGLD